MNKDGQKIAKEQFGERIRVRVGGICEENELVLMACHEGVISEKDVWLPPGGGVELGETIADALEREFFEETGFQIEVGAFWFMYEFIHPPLHAIELYFKVQIKSGELIKGTDPELNDDAQLIKDVRWVHKKDRNFFREDIYLKINS